MNERPDDAAEARSEEIRRRLEELRDEARAELDRLTGRPDPAETPIGFGKRVGDYTSVAVEAMQHATSAGPLTARRNDIDHALRKLDEGTYGLCENCGTAIGAERLAARPYAVRCRACA